MTTPYPWAGWRMFQNSFLQPKNSDVKIHRMNRPFLLLGRFLVIYCCASTSVQAIPNPQHQFAKERALFLKAEAAAQKTQWSEFKRLSQQLTHYPLYPYLLFKSYETNLDHLGPGAFLKFTKTYQDTPLAVELRGLWLNNKAKQEAWRDFLQGYVPSQDIALKCQYLWAELQTHHNSKPLEQVKSIWLTGKPLPKACDPIVTTWIKRGHLDYALIWQRIKLSIQANQNNLAKELSRYLSPDERPLIHLWIRVNQDPQVIFTQQPLLRKSHAAIPEMLIHGMTQIAQKNPEEALQLWPKLSALHRFTHRHWSLMVRTIAIQLAKKRHSDALKWLTKVPAHYSNDEVHEWKIRLSLLQQNWEQALLWIEQLPPHMATQEIWQYWRGRSLDMLNRPVAAKAIFNQLALNRSYYGFLSAQKIKKNHPLMVKKTVVTSEDLRSVTHYPGVLRAKELWLLGRHDKALKEWVLVTKHMNDQQRQSAAKLALNWGLPNWSIMAFAQAKNKDQLELRFPITHAKHVFGEALKHNIDPAWIFAITRQESAFVPTAKSKMGAMGLMQLMPGTARMLAKQSNLKLSYGLSDLFHPELNLRLGSRYLSMMLEHNRFNPILATAAYNAGPGRVKQWLPKSPMHSDAWIESIPFTETREYVKNVMTYTVIYQQILGHCPPFKPFNNFNTLMHSM